MSRGRAPDGSHVREDLEVLEEDAKGPYARCMFTNNSDDDNNDTVIIVIITILISIVVCLII